MLESYCNLMLDLHREFPDELREAAAGLIYASARCGDVLELQEAKGCHGALARRVQGPRRRQETAGRRAVRQGHEETIAGDEVSGDGKKPGRREEGSLGSPAVEEEKEKARREGVMASWGLAGGHRRRRCALATDAAQPSFSPRHVAREVNGRWWDPRMASEWQVE
uniref:Uncharacterized protein n=1 Tax=Oryza glumipatula TaxID=40148 RepID=A0A0D9ZQE9_9ORYZ